MRTVRTKIFGRGLPYNASYPAPERAVEKKEGGDMIELRNETDKEFIDISSELWRRYFFSTVSDRLEGEVVTILEPQWLSVSDNGSARILDGEGFCHYIPFGWIHLEWLVREDAPHFVK